MIYLGKPVKRWRDQRGVASLEFALVLPLLVLLVFGIMEYGWIFFRMHELSSTVRDAARVAVRPDTTDLGVRQRARSMMDAYGMGDSGYTLNIDPGSVETLVLGEEITVTIQVPRAHVDLMGLRIMPLPATLGATATMAKEGPSVGP